VVDNVGGKSEREKEREREREKVAMNPADPMGAIVDPGLAGRCRHQPTPFLPARSSQPHNFALYVPESIATSITLMLEMKKK